MIRWAALVFASMSWLFAFHQFVSTEPMKHSGLFSPLFHKDGVGAWGRYIAEHPMQFWQWLFILVAWLLGSIGFTRPARRMHLSPKYLALLIPAAVIALYTASAAAPAFRPPVLVLGVGILLGVLGSVVPLLGWLRSVGLSAVVLGAVLVLQSPCYWAWGAFTARSPDAPIFAPVVGTLLKWIGSDVSWNNGTLFVRLMRQVHVFPLTWNHVGLFPWLCLWGAGVAVLWWNRTRRPIVSQFVRLSIVLFVYATARLLFVIVLFQSAMLFVEHEEDTVHVELFWLPWISALTWLPVIPVLARWLPWRPGGAGKALRRFEWDEPGRRAWALFAACAASLGFVIYLYFPDAGRAKAGRVLLDESHSRWERTDNVYDVDWYGHESGYNYYCMAEYLRHFYQLKFNMEGTLTPDKLAQYDVLILKTPTEPYSPEEIDAIEAFVRRGGGLFALGEHTNVFGSSVFLNPVVRRFGLAFRYDSVFDIERKWEQVHFTRKFGVHPVVQRMPFDRFAVSCSITSDWWDTTPIIRSTGLWTLPIDYTAGNFYPKVEDRADAKFGAFDQMVEAESGRGRVIAFGDSTVYSNFLAFYPGKAEKLLGAVDWLNRTNRWNWISGIGLVVSVLGAVAAAVIAFRLRPSLGFAATVVSCGAAVAWFGIWACTALGRTAYAKPVPHTPVKTVVFDMDRSNFELPVFAFTKNFQNSYEIFYQWVLRLGYFTDVSFKLEKALAGSDPVVIIKPDKPIGEPLRQAFRRFLEGGGSALVLDSSSNTATTANELLEPYGVSFKPGFARGSALLEPTSKTRICTLRGAQSVQGGSVLLATEMNDPVAVVVPVGRGQLIVAGLADRFADTQMGGSSRIVPDKDLRAVYETEYALMKGLVEGDVKKHIDALAQTYAPASSTPAGAQTN